jgi:DNA-binding CsgD family transcriptional regulator
MRNGDDPQVDPRKLIIGRIMHQLILRGWRPPRTLPPAGFRDLVEDIVDIDRYHPTLDLSPQQLRILTALAQGATYPTAAERFGVGTETVKTQTKLIREKLGARNTTHAVAIAIREGVIT